MPITLNLPAETEAMLLREASERGVTPDEFVTRLVETAAPAEKPKMSATKPRLTHEEWSRRLREWVDTPRREMPTLSDEAISRDTIYD